MWCPLQRLLLDPQMQPARVGVEPEWTCADFVAQALRVAARLRETRPRAVALHFSDAARMACAFLACAHEGVAMVLPPNRLLKYPRNGQTYLSFPASSASIFSCSPRTAAKKSANLSFDALNWPVTANSGPFSAPSGTDRHQ